MVSTGLSTRTGSKSQAWTRTVAVTACLVALIQVCLFAASRLFSRASGPHFLVVSEVTALAIAELITVLVVYGLLRSDRHSLHDLGLWQRATTTSWLLGIGLGLLTAFWGLSNPALHLPSRLGALLDLSPWHLYSALVAGDRRRLLRGDHLSGFRHAGTRSRRTLTVGAGPWVGVSVWRGACGSVARWNCGRIARDRADYDPGCAIFPYLYCWQAQPDARNCESLPQRRGSYPMDFPRGREQAEPLKQTLAAACGC